MNQASSKALRSPCKLLLFTAFLLPALNTLLLGGGISMLRYSDYSDITLLLSEILSVIFSLLRYGLLTCTVMVLGFYAGKKGLKSAIRPLLGAWGGGAGVFGVSFLVQTLMIFFGYTDSVQSYKDQILPYVKMLPFELLLLLLVELAATVGIFLVCRIKGNRGMLSTRSPYKAAVLVFILCYFLALEASQIPVILAGSASGSFLVNYILPFVYPVLYGAGMVASAVYFEGILRKYFYGQKEGTP